MKKIKPIILIILAITAIGGGFASITAFIGAAIAIIMIIAFWSEKPIKNSKTGEEMKPISPKFAWPVIFVGLLIMGLGTDKLIKSKAEIAIEEKAKAQKDAADAKQTKLEKAFSVWDGSNPALEKLIKGGMNDTDSYKHLSTQVFDKQGYYFVRMEFSGKNKFGGTVRNTVTANIDYEGNVIKILEQY